MTIPDGFNKSNFYSRGENWLSLWLCSSVTKVHYKLEGSFFVIQGGCFGQPMLSGWARWWLKCF